MADFADTQRINQTRAVIGMLGGFCKGSTIEALRITYSILGVPYYDHGIMGPEGSIRVS